MGLMYNFQNNTRLLKVENFKLVDKKDGGISSGGVYADNTGHKWLLKEAQFGNLENGLNEYIAGGIYQHLLGPYAPRTELVYDRKNQEVLVGSKFLDNFQTLAEFSDGAWGEPNYLEPRYKGKPICNFNNVVSAIIFMQDTDAHIGNVGIVEEKDAWKITKIDHGFAFKEFGYANMKNFKDYMRWCHNSSIKKVGFENLYQSIKMIANINYDEIEKIVKQKTANARKYVKQLELDSMVKGNFFGTSIPNVDAIESNILCKMKNQLSAFKDMQCAMDIERAVKKDDVAAIKRLYDEGKPVNKKFFLFDNKEEHWDGVMGTSPYDLAKSYRAKKIMGFYEEKFGYGAKPAKPAKPAPVLFNKVRNKPQNKQVDDRNRAKNRMIARAA